MAHGDYNCCAICDRKLAYVGFDAATKEEICTDCLKILRDHKIPALDPSEFVEWALTTDADLVRNILPDIGFSYCIYPNNFDALIAERVGPDADLPVECDPEKARAYYAKEATP